MLNFNYSIPTGIFFGKGQIRVIGKRMAAAGGTKALICYGSERIKASGLFDTVKKILGESNIQIEELSGIEPNPRISSVRKGISICRERGVNFVLAIGGGSVIDCAKAIAAGFYYEGDPWDFFIRKAKITKALPIASVLTLAATGSEMNGNAVISNLETEQKLPVYSPLLCPVFSILDPEYTYTVPAYHTAAGVADIMSHVFEQYFCSTAESFIQDRLAEAVLKTCVEFGPVAIAEPGNYDARANLMWAGSLALNSLLTYGKKGEWAVHMIEHELSAVYDITHGAGLAILFPFWMEYAALECNTERLYNLAVNVFGVKPGTDRIKTAKEGILKIRSFFNSLGMPARLADVKIDRKRLNEIADRSVAYGALGTCKKLNAQDVLNILEMAG